MLGSSGSPHYLPTITGPAPYPSVSTELPPEPRQPAVRGLGQRAQLLDVGHHVHAPAAHDHGLAKLVAFHGMEWNFLMGISWLVTSEKYESQLGVLFPICGKIKI